MILNFASYINEMQELSDVKSQHKTFAEIMDGFKKLGYDFLGTLYWTNKDTGYGDDADVLHELFEPYFKLEKQIFGKYYLDFQDLDIKYKSRVHDIFDIADLLNDSTPNEKVVKFISPTKSGKNLLYYCFWNPTKKYFYIMNLSEGKHGNFSNVEKIFTIWMNIKTQGLDDIKLELEKIKNEEDLRHEEYLKKKEISRQKEEGKKQAALEVKEIVNTIKNDVETNKNSYKDIKWEYKKLPEKIKNDLDIDDPEEMLKSCTYFKYEQHVSKDPYDRAYVRCWVNNKDLSDGWVYDMTIDYAKPGTYWGD